MGAMETRTIRNTAFLRNVAFVGHGATGKTTLVEHLLLKAGAVARPGSVDEGSTVCDTSPDEKERKFSIDAAVAHAPYKGVEIHFLDAPGYPDFVGQAIGSLYAVETAMITVDAVAGVAVNTRKMWSAAGDLGLARVIVVNRMDAENASYSGVMQAIQAAFGEQCVPFTVPIGEGPGFQGVVPLLHLPEPIPDGCVDSAADLNQRAVERVVEADDEALEKYLEGEKPSGEELARLAKKAIASGTVVPVLFVSALKDIGVEDLLDFIAEDLPSPIEGWRRKVRKGTEGEDWEALEPDASGPLRAHVFKVMMDPYVGKVSTFRILSGALHSESVVLNPRTGKTEKLTHIFRPQGKDQVEVKDAIPGDILQVSKVDSFNIGDTLCEEKAPVTVPPMVFPTPMVSLAVEPKKRGDEAKISSALTRLDESDPCFLVNRDPQTHELVITGMSNLHVDVMIERLKRAGVEVNTKPPRIPYLETITAKGDAKYRHKKQTGGAGQFAEVWMRIEPVERGKGFEFENEVVGGAISASFVGSAEKGVRQVMEKGVLAGYPVVDVKVVVYDGKEHPVDSKDIAFQIAGRNAFKEAFLAARPVLLEPVVMLEIEVPSQYIGDVTGDISSRRGRVQGTDTHGDMQVIKALVPQSEVAKYSSELRSMTGGAGSFTMEFSHYDVVPQRLADQVIAQSKKTADEGE
jgi:elongation factor G